MDSDFFGGEQNQPASQPNQSLPQNQEHQEEYIWQETDPQTQNGQLETTHTLNSNNISKSNPTINFGSSNYIETNDQVLFKIRQQEQQIQEVLRAKASKEYEQKLARKEAGRSEIMEFVQKKQKQLEQRKLSNIEHQRQLIEKAKQLTKVAGWKKVFENVNLKQGEYKGKKQISRMRESIINKREDQINYN